MVMLQECSKNIEKLEFRPSGKKTMKEASVSPVKVSQQLKTTVCLVDLTRREDDEVKVSPVK
jgi:hypothetical protein